ncbi:hypothetical protein BUALT_Bualt08G0060600 [Buddleja alternifolia]|uniref:Uncharacterized protein n=1 Tax=Buddleja alternifolia TaxID=168488 RepID=A0AAV6X861_9LAMI|nr:hypothetical protein BUALT_Bualt08G0060600 [Buddleja alternifolia]
MKLQSACVFLQSCPPPTHLSPPQLLTVNKNYGNHTGFVKQLPRFHVELKSMLPSLRSGVILRAANLNSSRKLGFRVDAIKGSEPFRGKSGSVSFGGSSHQSVEESKLASAPFKENSGSLLWVLAPVALISSLVVPQFFIVSAIEDVFKNEVFSEIVSFLSTEVIFYAGLAMFLLITERVQKPYLDFSPKRWSLITGLKGYLTSAFFTMGFKVFAPIIAVYVTWPSLGLPALVSVAPFLAGCLAQYAFERRLESNGSSCWPLLPIIFEVYRIYQLTRATSFMEKLIYGMREASINPAVLDRTGALVSMIVTFRVLGVVCLWSLLTFLMRLFPSRPVAENY